MHKLKAIEAALEMQRHMSVMTAPGLQHSHCFPALPKALAESKGRPRECGVARHYALLLADAVHSSRHTHSRQSPDLAIPAQLEELEELDLRNAA